jgi:RNA polymerase sigma-70 factor (ECF subfamily)
LKPEAKIIKLHSVEINDWIDLCQQGNTYAQRKIYEEYAPTLLGICRRYLKNQQDAEDALMEAFYTIFSKINTFKGQGSFEGWIKKVTVNHCLMAIRKAKPEYSDLDEQFDISSNEPSPLDEIYESELLDLLDRLPDGYRTVFNLYVIEGYKHKEIAEALGISINTSKSQLILARKKMAMIINELQSDDRSNEK